MSAPPPHPAASASKVARIALATAVDELFDYLPGALAQGQRPGTRVRVEFGSRRLVGVFTGWAEGSRLAADRLKPVLEVLDTEPVIPASLLELLRRAAQYYHHPLGEVVLHALPVLLREGQSAQPPASRRWYAVRNQATQPLSTGRRAPLQHACLTLLLASPQGLDEATLLDALPNARDVLRRLLAKGLVRFEVTTAHPATPLAQPTAPGPMLNDAQRAALKTLKQGLGQFSVGVLEGVTGSGKTEVYLALIEHVLAQGRQVLVLAPEISLTPQLLSRFRARLPVAVVGLHSGLTPSERLAAWRAAQCGAARVVIGTRSAIFTPMPELGLIVVDEEHDASFKQQDGFRYHARDLAVWRGQIERVAVILGSATPSLETLANVERGQYRLAQLGTRAGSAGAPRLRLVDLRRQKLAAGLSRHLIEAMHAHLTAGQQVMLFLNRRGYAPVLLCHVCGTALDCPRCDAHTTFHARAHELRCHHCGYAARPPAACPACGSVELVAVGIGTERLEALIREAFPERRVVRLDRDVTRRKGELEARLQAIERGEFDIVVGTQLLSKGHDFPRLTLVGIIDVDQGLFSSDFRAPERLLQQVLQVAGRAGRGSVAGEVILQTHQPEHPLLRGLLSAGYDTLSRGLLAERRLALWPPYASIALLRVAAPSETTADRFLTEIVDTARGLDVGGVEILGPVTAPLTRKAGHHQYHVLFRAAERRALHRLLTPLIAAARALKSARRLRWSIDVDPIELS